MQTVPEPESVQPEQPVQTAPESVQPIQFDYVQMYEKYKDATTIRGKIKFAILHRMKDSPYYDEPNGTQMLKDLGKDDPAAYFHLFIESMFFKKYVDAFEYFKLFDPFLFVVQDKHSELQILYFDYGSGYVELFKEEIKYFEKISCNWDTRHCDICSYGQFCIHRKLNNHDLEMLAEISRERMLMAKLTPKK